MFVTYAPLRIETYCNTSQMLHTLVLMQHVSSLCNLSTDSTDTHSPIDTLVVHLINQLL